MASSIKLSVRFSSETVADFNEMLPNVPWSWDELLKEMFVDHDFTLKTSPMTVGALAQCIDDKVVDIYERQMSRFVDRPGKLIFQVYRLQVYKSEVRPRFPDLLLNHMKPGDTVIADAQATLLQAEAQPIQWTEKDLEKFRQGLRFSLNDRVVCNFGPRWISGHIVGTAVPEEQDILPYLVKTDALPGLPTNSISVPLDSDQICMQEVCFDPTSQLHLVKASAAIVSESSKPKLRFVVGDKVVCRIRNDPKDGLEQWVPGAVSMVWPNLPGDEAWLIDGVSGKFPSLVPYKIELTSGGWIYCHRDNHTLIRRQGFEPQTRVRGISKRMELRKCADGGEERLDHVTERRKRIMTTAPSDSE